MKHNVSTVTRTGSASVLATNSVLRNTFLLLAFTTLFSAVTAMLSINARPVGLFGLLGMLGLMHVTMLLRNSAWGILSVFAFTGFTGYIIGPIIGSYLRMYTNGAELVTTAFGLTGIIFFALAAYAMTTRKDFSYLGGFVVAAISILFVSSLLSLFFYMPILNLMISAGFALVATGAVLWHLSNIIHGYETNYIMATISIYVNLYNLFLSLLQILGAFAGRRD